MKIATWNVNSLKVRLPQVLDWLASAQPDVLCLQEIKLEDAHFPFAAFADAGYQAVASGQKTYNGVAIVSRYPLERVSVGIAGFDDPQRRVIAATVAGLRVVSVYVPNGQALDSPKFAYKREWLAALTGWLAHAVRDDPALIVAGDFNIAPQPDDAHPDWPHTIHVSVEERGWFAGLLALGLTDAFRQFAQAERSYSWWDYRVRAFARNLGLRIDHLLISEPLQARCTACAIDRAPRALERPSDHAPVWLTLDGVPLV